MGRSNEYYMSFFPPLTPMMKKLIIVTAGAFVLTYVLGHLGSQSMRLYFWLYPIAYGGLRPYYVIHHLFLWQPFTYLFLHDGFFHILFNLFALWMFGSDLERLWGGRKFLFYFFLCGVGAAVFDVLVQPSSRIPTIGNSGAIFGILLAFGVLWPDRPIFLWFVVPVKAKWFVIGIGAIEFLSELGGAQSGIAHLAHLGGMLVGYLYLRGGRLSGRAQSSLDEWRRARLRKKFEAHMRKQEKKKNRDGWVN